jgi:rhomboid protease GluP
VLAQAVQALAAGNAVVGVAVGAAAALAPLKAAGLPVAAFDGQVEPDALTTLAGLAQVAASGPRDWLKALRVALAARDGAIVPLEIAPVAPERYFLERHLCIDTTAAGGTRTFWLPALEQTLKNPHPGDRTYKPLPRVLIGLVGVIALIETVLSIADAGYFLDNDLRIRAFAIGAFWSGLLHGEYSPIYPGQEGLMFVTHALLHGGFLHMLMNSTILLALGRFVEEAYDPRAILPVFFLGAIGGGAAYGLLSAGPYPMVGASGAVFAFLGLWVAWDWRRHRLAGASVRPIYMRVAVLAGLNVVFYFGLGGMLAWQAHLGGFLVGLFIGAILEKRLARRERAARAEVRRRFWRGE